MNKTITTEEACTHEPLVDTGVGYYHCPACNQGCAKEQRGEAGCKELCDECKRKQETHVKAITETAVMCCNHCGMPDEPFWQPPTDAVEEGEEIVVSMAGKKLKRDVDYSYENGVITIFNHNIN